jgi:hypothetical protein
MIWRMRSRVKLGIVGLAVPDPPVKAVNFRDDRGPRVLPLRSVGRQTVGRRFDMVQPQGDVEPVETRRARGAGIDQDRPQTETTVGEGSQFGSVSTL